MGVRRLVALAAGLALLGTSLSTIRAEEAGKAEWGYEKGFYFKADKFELKVGGRLQFRYTLEDPEDGDSAGSFRIRRAKFFGSGYAYHPWIQYKFQFNAVGANNVTGLSTTTAEIDTDGDSVPDTTVITDVSASKSRGFELEDFYVDITKARLASLRVGQYKAPFGQQELTSSGSQQFVDRSLASEAFAPGRDQGLDLFGATESKLFGYDVGIFNGNGRNKEAKALRKRIKKLSRG